MTIFDLHSAALADYRDFVPSLVRRALLQLLYSRPAAPCPTKSAQMSFHRAYGIFARDAPQSESYRGPASPYQSSLSIIPAGSGCVPRWTGA